MTKYPDLILEIQGNTGLITLNRPKALNALSLTMLQGLNDCLSKWADDTEIHQVIIQGDGGRAFCAGGDIRSLYDARQKGDMAFISELFRLEYTVNYQIATFPKPYIALMDGFVFGGGCGVSVHGSHRIVTERTILAMPETCIGYFPDIGASYFLSKSPGYIGLYLGLTGTRIKTADILHAKLADTCVPSSELAAIRQEIIIGAPLDDIIGSKMSAPLKGEFVDRQEDIDDCFSANSLRGIIERLKSNGAEWCQNTLDQLSRNSPFSLEVSFKLLKNKDIMKRDSLIQDFRIAQRLIHRADFYEGIRAILVDKDNTPNWSPSELNRVQSEQVSACFEPLENDELSLPE